MAKTGRPGTGSIRQSTLADGQTSFAARFTDQNGKRVDLPIGRTPEMSPATAQTALSHIMADVARGIWTDPRPAQRAAASRSTETPTFHHFSSDWYASVKDDLAPKTQADYLWRLGHLNSVFETTPLDQITIEAVDNYRKLKRKRLSASSVNKTIMLMSRVLRLAVSYERVGRNVAGEKERLAKVSDDNPKNSSWLDYDHLMVFLEAAERYESERTRETYRIGVTALMTTMFCGGLRVSEACALTWSDVHWERGVVSIGRGKTKASVRQVSAPLCIFEALSELRSTTPFSRPLDPVFATARGTHRTKDNVRQRLLLPVRERAELLLSSRGMNPLPNGITNHSGRRTAITMWLEARSAENEWADSAAHWVARQVGHSDTRMTTELYEQTRDRERDERVPALMRPATKEELRALAGRNPRLRRAA